MGYHQAADTRLNKLDCMDLLQFQGLHLHKKQAQVIKSAAYTLLITDNGKFIFVDTTAVITLPTTAANMGPFTIVNYGEEDADTGISDVEITVRPDSGKMIVGPGITGGNDKDIVNTLATARRGDYVKIFYAGSIGWSVGEMAGTWTRET